MGTKMTDLAMDFAENPGPESGLKLVAALLNEDRPLEAFVIANRCVKTWPKETTSHEALCLVHLSKGNTKKLHRALADIPSDLAPTPILTRIAEQAGRPFKTQKNQPTSKTPIPAPKPKASIHNAASIPEPPKSIAATKPHPRKKPVLKKPTIRPVAITLAPAPPAKNGSRAKRSLVLAATLCTLFAVYFAWTWQAEAKQAKINELILSARKLIRQEKPALYHQALSHYEQALAINPQESSALSGSAHSAVLVWGETDRNEHNLAQAKAFIARAETLGVESPQLRSAHALLLGYSGKIAEGRDLLTKKQQKNIRSRTEIETIKRLSRMEKKAEATARFLSNAILNFSLSGRGG